MSTRRMNTPDFAGGGRRSDGPSRNLRRFLAAVSVASLLVAGRAWAVAAGSQFSVVPTPTSRVAGQMASPTVVVSATQADAEQATAEPSSSTPEDPAPPASPTTARKISGPVASTAPPTVAAPVSGTPGRDNGRLDATDARATTQARVELTRDASAQGTRFAITQTVKALGTSTVDVSLAPTFTPTPVPPTPPTGHPTVAATIGLPTSTIQPTVQTPKPSPRSSPNTGGGIFSPQERETTRAENKPSRPDSTVTMTPSLKSTPTTARP
jgi:hypothetical protein